MNTIAEGPKKKRNRWLQRITFFEVGTSKNVQPIRKVLHKHFAARDAITPRALKGFKCLFCRAFFYTEPVSH